MLYLWREMYDGHQTFVTGNKIVKCKLLDEMRRARPGVIGPSKPRNSQSSRESIHERCLRCVSATVNSENGAHRWFLFTAASITLGQENYVSWRIFQGAKLGFYLERPDESKIRISTRL